MIIPPKYELTKEISLLLGQLEANRTLIDALPLPVAIEENFRRASFLGSSLFSARIEGNRLIESDLSDFRDLTSQEKQKVEVANLIRATKTILEKYSGKKLIFLVEDILNWHRLAMENILAGDLVGVFRTGHEGIFTPEGFLVYHAPPPAQINALIKNLLNFINTSGEIAPIKASLAHLIFEKIHPFADGSGRVGRLLQFAVLVSSGYAMKGLVVVEKEIEQKRQLYYQAIQNSDATEFLQLMLELLVVASEKTKDKILSAQKFSQEDLLAPRRKEILEIIRDHQMVSFDFLHRRFMNINPRLLAYDIKYLMDNGFVSKIGKTRGALYRPVTR